jgi:hypothetical protein
MVLYKSSDVALETPAVDGRFRGLVAELMWRLELIEIDPRGIQ